MENKKNDDTGWLLLASLDKLTKKKKELHDKINQLPASQKTAEDTELSDKIDWLQMLIV